MKALLFTDGGARGNPGPAAIGGVLRIEGKSAWTFSEFIGEATNNVAEYRALLRGLQEAKRRGVTTLACRLDSELLVKQLNRVYKVRDKDLQLFFVQVWNAAQGFRSVTFAAVPRSVNREADRLVNEALTKAGYPKQAPPGFLRDAGTADLRQIDPVHP